MERYRLISLETSRLDKRRYAARHGLYGQSIFLAVGIRSDHESFRVDDSEKDNAVLVFHEYYHIVQAQNVFSNVFITDETGNTVRPEYGQRFS